MRLSSSRSLHPSLRSTAQSFEQGLKVNLHECSQKGASAGFVLRRCSSSDAPQQLTQLQPVSEVHTACTGRKRS
eukprot:symbB.v1.2.017758.t1/scaffold1389.1/size122275/7